MKSERLGLWMVMASLAVIALIVGLLVHSQQEARRNQLQTQGAGIAHLLSSMPMERLVPTSGQQGPLEIINSTQANSDFAYAVVEDPTGSPLARTTAPGVIVPTVGTGVAEPSAWFGQREIPRGTGTETFREFYAPVLHAGDLVALVRIGYLEPRLLPSLDQLSFFALVALPIFLLVPAFYLVIRKELFSLKRVSDQMQSMLEDNPIRTVELNASGEVGDFISNFNRVVQAADQRIRLLEERNTGTLTSSKVLSYQKARIESVLQSLPDSVVIMDEAAKVTFASLKLRTLIGIDPDSIVGASPHEWCTDETLLTFITGLGGATGRRAQTGSLEFTPEGAPERRIAVSAFPLFSPRDESNVFGNIVLFHDASVEALAREARKEFVAHLSHELKTPLHVIGMYAENLRDGDGDSEQLRIDAGNVIHDEVERMTALIKNLLSITEIEMGSLAIDRKRTRLDDLLEDVLDAGGRGAAGQGLEITLDIQGDMGPANIDKDLMRVAINNLITNAIKYNRPGGKVHVEARDEGSELVISVKDTGIGIAESDLEHVFDRFYRAESHEVRERPGNGLGLALAREIVLRHDGDLRVESQLGVGTEFTIVLKSSANLLKEAI